MSVKPSCGQTSISIPKKAANKSSGLNDPGRRGTLCFEEPENSVHEGRVPLLVEFLRNAASVPLAPDDASFQVILNTHSPKVMAALQDREIVAADSVTTVDPEARRKTVRTRMRTRVQPIGDMFAPELLTRFEVETLLQKTSGAA